MKILILTIVALVSLSGYVFSQSTSRTLSIEQQIRDREKLLVEALLRQDIKTIDQIFADDLYVNAPSNRIAKKPEVLQRIRDRQISYSAFTAEIEEIIVLEETVVVMGRETVRPIDNAPFAGKTVERRYTQIWVYRDGRWQMTARHANVICSN